MSTFADKMVADAEQDGAEGDILERIRTVAEIMAPHIPETDEVVKRAAFFNADDSEASIVIQSLDTDRRLNINVLNPGEYGDWIGALMIDENQRHTRRVAPIDSTDSIKDWVKLTLSP